MVRPYATSLTGVRRGRNRLLVTVSVAGLLAFLPVHSETGLTRAMAQEVVATDIFDPAEVPRDEQLLLESDELVYDNDRGLVIALGNVQIAYGDFTLVANKVEYNQQSGRVIAFGNVEILEPNGNRIFADEIDITDDFRDGFVSALNVQTPDNTRIAAESGERRDGEFTIFNNGVYTACKQCAENPEKPPFWQIRAKKVTINNQTRAIEYEDATFEFFGKPVARLSRFAHADPAIKRKSGFLVPRFHQSEDLGIGVRNAYFFNLAHNYDLTLSGTYYTRQGFLGEAEWRHRTRSGQYNIRFAGIDQQERSAFDATSVDRLQNTRKALMTTGRFAINPRWTFGWNALFQSDENFARTYNLSGYSSRDITNEVYLTGLGEKNFFDLRAQDFLVQDNRVDFDTGTIGNQHVSEQQATLLPSFDYNAVSGEEFSVGQVSLDVNVASVSRDVAMTSNIGGVTDPLNLNTANDRFHGLEGQTSRASALLEWKASHVTGGGLVTTGSLSVQGDAIWQDTDNLASPTNPLLDNDSIYRVMPAAMLEIRYPLIADDGFATHLFEPIAQVIIRPDEENIGEFANEDAQSLVFDTSNLFERDKFSGFDRVEGGSRANVGFRYSASFEDGSSIDVVAGQSFHLAGQNSFAQRDLTNTGAESGLESDRSDFVASIQWNNAQGISIGAGARLDNEDASLNRGEIGLQIVQPNYSVNASYVFVEEQPNYRFDTTAADNFSGTRHELRASASVRLDENWRLFGGAAYDLDTGDFISDSIGIAYDDDCFSFSINYAESRSDRTGDEVEQSVGFRLGLRTIGGYGYVHKLDENEN